MALRNRIEEATSYRGISQNEVERRCGFKPGVLAMLKKRPNPKHEKLEVIASVLGVSLEWLKKGEGAPNYETPWSSKSYQPDNNVVESTRPEPHAPHVVSRVKPDSRIVYDERYPNRGAVVALYEGIAPQAAINAFLMWSLNYKTDLAEEEWRRHLERFISERKQIEKDNKTIGKDVDPTTLDLHIQPKTRYIIAYYRT